MGALVAVLLGVRSSGTLAVTPMQKRFREIFYMMLGLGTVAGAAWLVYWLVRSFFVYLSAVPKEIGAALVAAMATVLVATITVMVGRYFERKRELDSLYRDKKVEIYDEFLQKFFALFHSNSDASPTPAPEDLVPFLREFMRKLILWGGPETIAAFLEWKRHLEKGIPDAQTIFLTEKFLLAVRTDLRNSNRGIPKGFFAYITLKEAGLFMALAKDNPNVTLEHLSEVEKILKKGVGSDATTALSNDG